MAKVQTCVFCAKELDPGTEAHVVVNRETVLSPDQWEYAHTACYEQQKDQPTE
jgi:hypothetical protein